MGTPVTDPKLLAVLNAQGQQPQGQQVTDPKLLAVLNSGNLPASAGVQGSSPGGGMQQQSPLQQGLHGLGLAANSIIKGAGAAPAYLLDLATSPLRDTHAGIGRDINQLGYTVQKPSELWTQAIDKLIPSTPQNAGEQVANFVGQMGGGMLGPAIGTKAEPTPAQTQLQQNLQTAGQNGVRVTPGEAHAGPIARAVEGLGGKGKLANKNQVMNQGAINRMMASEFNLPPDTQFSPDTFKSIENQAVQQGYTPLESTPGLIRFGQDYRAKLGDIVQKWGNNNSFDGAASNDVGEMVNSYKGSGVASAADAMAAVRQLRAGANAAFNSSNPLFNPSMGQAKLAVANAIEDNLASELGKNPDTAGLVPAFQSARQTIAKSKAAQEAFQPASGMWNANALTTQLNNGEPLTGNLRAIAQLGGSFKKSMRVPVQGMPPAISGTKILGVPATVIGSLMSGHPAGALLGGALLAPDAARGLATSSLFQNNMVNGTGALAGQGGNAANALPALMQMIQQGQGSLFAPQSRYPTFQPQQQK